MSARVLRLAADLALPLELVTESVGILAVKRAGKSHTAKKLTEQLHRAGQQVVVVDPKGDWWGLRSSADGRGPGLPVVILGGEHGDVALEPGAGELVGKLVVEQRVSLVLDLSELRKYQVATFMTAFLETLYRLKAKDEYRTPCMLVIDEADAIAPQRPAKGEERMLGAAEDIVRRGGQRGIGITLVSQRAAVLNKNVLTQVGVLILLRTTGSQDIDAVDEWIKKHGQPAERERVMAGIAQLPRGTCWVWAPGWPDERGIFRQVTVGPIDTFDSGATPKPGERQARPKTVADVDLVAFRREMAATIERAKQEDPKELRREMASLRGQLTAAQKQLQRPAAAPAPIVAPKRVEVPVLPEPALRRLEKVAGQLASLGDSVVAVGREIAAALARLPRNGNGHGPAVTPARAPAPPRHAIAPRPPRAANDAPAGSLSGLQQRILNALAWLDSLGVAEGDRAQVALIARAKPTGGHYSNQVSALRTLGLLAYPRDGALALTDTGLAAASLDQVPQTTHQLQQQVFGMVTGLQRKILEHLVRAYPASMSREDVAAAVGADPSGGHFSNQVSALRTLGVVDYPAKGQVAATSVLFLEGR